MTDQELVRADLDALYLGNLGTVEFDLDLPTTGANGSTITWESDMPHFLAADGTVSRPAYGRGNRTVTLTATATRGEHSETRAFEAQVLECDAEFEVVSTAPVRLSARPHEALRLPTYLACATDDGRILSLPVSWEGGSEHLWDAPGTHDVSGTITGQDVPVRAHVLVASHEVRCDGNRAGVLAPARTTRLVGDSDLLAAQERMHEWLSGCDVDHFLYNFRVAAGLDTRGAEPMQGWDSPEGLLRGHTTGHLLSALAKCWHATGDEAIRDKACELVAGLAECRRGLEARGCAPGFLSAYDEGQFDDLERYVPYPKIWAPWYTLHKILAGLLDAAELCGDEQALGLATGVGEWAWARLSRLDADQLQRMWGIYIAGEYGGMNEALARLGELTGNDEFVACARLFDNDRLLYPLAQGVDALDGMHANQHIPQVIGYFELYRATGERRYLEAARRFWEEVTGHHAYAIGGTGESEMFHAPGAIAGLLTASTCESCASYNMLKLTGLLHCRHPHAAYMDYYERTLLNHTLATCDHEPTGGTTYFISMEPGARKEIDLAENSCCHGTGLEQPSMYADHVFHVSANPERDGDVIAVELFVPAEVTLEDGTRVAQAVDPAHPGHVTLQVSCTRDLRVYVRVPSWCVGTPAVVQDGISAVVPLHKGYLIMDFDAEATCVEVTFGERLRCEPAPDDPSRYVVFYGPYALAALSTVNEPLAIPVAEAMSLEPVEGEPLCFTHPASGTRFVPFERVSHEAYHLYLRDA